jgi:hypothetical protein
LGQVTNGHSGFVEVAMLTIRVEKVNGKPGFQLVVSSHGQNTTAPISREQLELFRQEIGELLRVTKGLVGSKPPLYVHVIGDEPENGDEIDE